MRSASDTPAPTLMPRTTRPWRPLRPWRPARRPGLGPGRRLAGLLLAWAMAWPAHAGDVYVVAHPALNLSADEVREVFTGDKQSVGGIKLVPMDNSSLQGDFLARVLKVDATKYASVWAKKGFREGINPPPLRGSDLEVIAAVKSTPGAVAYVAKPPADLKLVQKY